MRPHENKFKPLEIDASHMAMIQGQTEVLLQRQASNTSILKQGSGSMRNIEDVSFHDLFSQTEYSKDTSLKQADMYHSYGW